MEEAISGSSPGSASHDLSKLRVYDRERVLTRVSHVRSGGGLVGRARVFPFPPAPLPGPAAPCDGPCRDTTRVSTRPATTTASLPSAVCRPVRTTHPRPPALGAHATRRVPLPVRTQARNPTATTHLPGKRSLSLALLSFSNRNQFPASTMFVGFFSDCRK